MSSITYETIFYENKNCILIKFEFNAVFNKRLQKGRGAEWSETLHGCTIPDTTENRIKCKLPVQHTPEIKPITPYHKNPQ